MFSPLMPPARAPILDLIIAGVAVASIVTSGQDRNALAGPELNLGEPTETTPTTSTAPTGPRSEIVWVDPTKDLAPDIVAAQAPVSPTLFVNRCIDGCTITPGVNDSRADTSSIPETTVSLAEFEHGDEVFDQTIACLREVYAPYNVEIVTEDPGNVPHHEAILAGNSGDLGFPDNVGGLAPSSCTPLDNVISYSFASTLGADPIVLCWTLAQESAHAFIGPNHVRDCYDPMTYIPDCGQKIFRDEGLQCGEFEPSECRCGGGQFRNSHRGLLEVFGPGQTPAPPEVIISSPATGSTVEPGFAIVFSVADKRIVEKVYVMVNGTLWDQRDAFPATSQDAPYRFVLSDDLPDGVLNIEVRARNDAIISGSSSITVTKGAPCTSADTCLDGQTCESGACSFEPASTPLGLECSENRECFSGLCPTKGGNQVCSEFCNPADDFSCPLGFECVPAQSTGVCWPLGLADIDSGGCCQVATPSSPPLGPTLLVITLGLLGFRRRSKR